MSSSHNTAQPIQDGSQRALLSVDNVAAELACSTRHVRRLADSGRMPRPIKLGSLVRWQRDVIDQWIADGCPNTRNIAKGGRR